MGALLLSRWSWSVHLVRGRPAGRFHVGSGVRPTDSSTWRSVAQCAGMLSGNLATCLNMALRPLVISSDSGKSSIFSEKLGTVWSVCGVFLNIVSCTSLLIGLAFKWCSLRSLKICNMVLGAICHKSHADPKSVAYVLLLLSCWKLAHICCRRLTCQKN